MVGNLFSRNSDGAAEAGYEPKKADGQNPLPETFGLKFVFDSGEAHVFNQLPLTIGRNPGSSIELTDETVSAMHALVVYDTRLRQVCIEDTDSLNGVLINGLPTRKNILQDGVQIRLGKAALVFWDTGYLHPGGD